MQDKLQTIGRVFLNRVELSKSKNAIGWIEDSNLNFYTYNEYKSIVSSLSHGLTAKGLKRGDRVAILSNTCKEWHLIDLSLLCSSAVVVPIYHTYLSNEISYLINHSESKIICVEDKEQFTKLSKVKDSIPSCELIVSFADLSEKTKSLIPNIETISYKELLLLGGEVSKGSTKSFEDNIKQQSPKDIASIIYTSGTTGEPKGAVITQQAFAQMLQNVKTFVKGAFNEFDRSLTFLPLSHVIGRCDSFLHLTFGSEMVLAQSIEKVIDDLTIVKPTFMLAVPRIFEKIYGRIHEVINAESVVKRKTFQWANMAANRYFSKIDKDLSPSTYDIIQYELAYKFVFEKFYKMFGGRIRFFVSGGAPLSPKIIKFLRNANLPILEGYGLTETVGPAIVNPVNRQVPGSVGKPIGDVQVKFGEDNEILIKTKAMLTEYYKNENATSESIKDGWFYTGDIGNFDQQGFLRITDRKKDIIITSGGKNVAPQKIENLMKLKGHISHFVVYGDQQRYLTGLVAIDKENFKSELEEIGLDIDVPLDQMAHNPKIRAILRSEIEEVNAGLASFETIKKFYVIPQEISTSNYLTPSLKIKKKLLFEDYGKEINAMYN